MQKVMEEGAVVEAEDAAVDVVGVVAVDHLLKDLLKSRLAGLLKMRQLSYPLD